MICPILRAALGMLESVFKMILDASVGFLGFVRNEETLKADFYFQQLPKDAKKRTIKSKKCHDRIFLVPS